MAGGFVKSRVTVGKGVKAERDAKGYCMCIKPVPEADTIRELDEWWVLPVVEPEMSMVAAAEVVLAITVAAGGRGWLWMPS